ncbi:complex I subunit 4 family protein [Acetobacter peroxydans]|uniref:NADH-quinone oxidoreductase subunit M n=1 Tax=Acetobacter peroxydans TaxID=104098 RepID=A0A4Y3TVG3_9PROT|nr:NADH-quinone oxidoreductase subunit M [Acetobacter peroxydans]NHO15158.1 NADH-quinone oxidoreductase subunit M [Acetobacter peroxydans]GBR35186.1 NADH-quinone oxidoreductase chain M [Acetobacter peroxydans NBRC 13755]GBR41183.1 NADH-quinone oxidoreductase chain M [Acetobacter peroxydans]GEB84970.1 NADH-quinone oxidoreductase subunit M [Acetobacter peroxydans]
MQPILLSLITYLPLAGALVAFLCPGGPAERDRAARWLGLWTTLVTLGLSVLLWIGFDPAQPGLQYETRLGWLSEYGITYHTGVDGISLVFVLLTAFLTPLSLLAGWRSVQTQGRDFVAMLLMLETALFGLFSAQDLVLFYVFYEATLIPGSLMIGIWGGQKRVWASLQFFLFTFAGSLFMLVGLITMWLKTGTTDIPTLMATGFSQPLQGWLLLAFVLAFGVKLPLFPLHAWLPDAYTEAPTPATAMMSGVLSKTGAYGLLRFGVLMFPDAARSFAPYILALGVAAILYAAIVAYAQSDMKRMVAYSSFSHMGMIAVGLFTLTAEGIDGAIFQMLSHGVVIAALFFCVAAVAWRAETRDIDALGGVAKQMPMLALLAMLFTMANVGLPGTGSFVGELLVLMGAVHVSLWVALLAGSTMILGAVYMLSLYRRVLFGSVKGTVSLLRDLTAGEMAILVPLAVVTLWMGVHPSTFTRLFDPVVMQAVQGHVATGLSAGATHVGTAQDIVNVASR